MGSRLTSLSNDSTSITYSYDASGQRVSKTVNGVTTEFYYDDRGVLVLLTNDDYSIRFYADAEGNIDSFSYNNEQFYYVRNAQNDVIGITDSTGAFVAKYSYDEWGNITSITDGNGVDVSANPSHIANINPLRYRSYFYDAETGFYWLNTRYYDSEIGRFINADVTEAITPILENVTQYNLFAYCFNNPINLSDDNGAWPSWAKKLVAAVAVVAVVATVAVVTVATAGAGTAAAAVAIGAAKGAAVGMVSGAAVGAATGAVSHRVSTGSWDGAGEAALNGMGDGALSGAITGAISGAASGAISNSPKPTPSSPQTTGGACFIAGTLVLTEQGNVPIESIEAGDLVWACNPETNEVSLKRVVRTFVKQSEELVHIKVADRVITCTNEHPFYSPVKGWIAACQLRAGDILVTVNGEYVVIEKVQHELLESPVTVYNFEVEDFHTYHAGDCSVLVHNSCHTPDQQALIELAKENKNGVNRNAAETLVEWAQEYGISNHPPMTHPTRGGFWSVIEHIKIHKLHIQIKK